MVAKLHSLFHPELIAIIGASNTTGKLGNILAERAARGGFPTERIVAVNPKSDYPIAGLRTVGSLADIGRTPDVAVITTPAPLVPAIAHECGARGVKYLVIITAGFGEVHTEEGDRLDKELRAALVGTETRVIGPNCFGIMNMHNGLDLTFGQTGTYRAGRVSILSQSGGVAVALVDRARGLGVGLSKVITMGNASDVSWRDYLSYLGHDRTTDAIFLYIEGVGDDAEGFLSSLREVSENKLVVIFKPGRSEAAAKAAATHTGSLAGDDHVFDAAIRRTQAIRVDALDEMFYAAVVANQQLPRSDRYTFLTNGGGPGVIAADRAALSGLTPSTLTPETLATLDAICPPNWSHGNPVDIIGDAGRERYYKSVSAVLADMNTESLIVMYIPTAMSPPEEVAKGIIQAVSEKRAEGIKKPVFVVWMGGWSISGGKKLLQEAQIPVMQNPDTAARILGYLAEYRRRHTVLYEQPRAVPYLSKKTLTKVTTILEDIRASGRTLLSEVESKEILRLVDITTNTVRVARNTLEASALALVVGLPVVLKAHAEIVDGVDPRLAHKSEFGVHLNLYDPVSIGFAFEAIKKSVTEKLGAESFRGVTVQSMVKTKNMHEIFLGTMSDPHFGPVLVFGRGGTHVEYYGDTAMGINELSSAQMRHVMEQTRVFEVLQGVRGAPAVDITALTDAGVRLSQLATACAGLIRAIDVNPLLAGPSGICALDARIELVPRGAVGVEPAIRPYPTDWVTTKRLANRERVTVRPIDASDEEKLRRFHELVSTEDVYHRYQSAMSLEHRKSHERLAPRCNIDYRRNMAFVSENSQGDIVSITRMVRTDDADAYEMAFFTRTDYKGRRNASLLMEVSIAWATSEGIPKLVAMTERSNRDMRSVFTRAGFTETFDPEDRQMVYLEKVLV